jgi:hypothetical protein
MGWHYTMEEHAECTDFKMERTAGNRSSFAAVNVTESQDENPVSSKSLKGNKSPSVGPRKSTGPRTQQGRARSKLNSITHGLFSSVAVLKGESKTDLDALLNGLRKDLQPVGTLEDVLIEKLAVLFWRSRRLLAAEGAEIRARAEFVEWEGKERDREAAAQLPQFSCNRGLMRWVGNRLALQWCLNLLEDLKDRIESCGFTPETDKTALTRLYGEYDQKNSYQPLFGSYLLWSRAASFSVEECQRRELPSPEESKEGFLGEVKEEIKRLRHYEKEQEKVVSGKMELESLRHGVPDAPQLDRLLRYETTLERAIDRTLNQLERYQRIRLGQPVLPPINLNVSSS